MAAHIAFTQPTSVRVKSPHVQYQDSAMVSQYDYHKTLVETDADGNVQAVPTTTRYELRTETNVPKLGVMLVGLGGNNGTTVVGATVANRLNLQWNDREGLKSPNYWGSVTQASTTKLGVDAQGNDVFVPFASLLPMVHPNDVVFDGWDISGLNLADAMDRAQVLEYDLRRQLKPHLAQIVPRPGIYYPDFIAANQADRADNVLAGTDKQVHLDQLRADIRDFKTRHQLDKVIVLWTANTERFADVTEGVNTTATDLLQSIRDSHPEVAPSTVYAVAAVLEGCAFINGSPQNTNVPGLIELAEQQRVFVGGDDFKSGQTKMKSVLVDFLVNAGIKPVGITSYNHLGNNDGKNLSAPSQFRSKEISKSNVVDDMVASNGILYQPGEHPDHVVVIKYVPAVGDSKRALDEYYSKIFMHGTNTISMHNTCEDSLLATPLIIDLFVLCELLQRISWRVIEGSDDQFRPLATVCSPLSYLLKAPLVPHGAPVVNALFKQRSSVINLLRACLGLAPESHMGLEHITVNQVASSTPSS
ncbi:uncharacterized protein MONBRDRAFT_31130 [Monosiga brevicollis MX1]|uniref:inositol-3-phosphate synthase n=1 Tax=Monosiga brevicollis TaxID=81824 RepID=A9URX8_MONBE|nr:uncharacterized protein MONBRDRAFT_31130 [Monosiga brevicollis MX1]EDQ92005.1 predicted protein [Monosiga brevicollis MX1]|eukprot:XP_001743291.1 hypothetical protein [Monosiga brevicollis MX1]